MGITDITIYDLEERNSIFYKDKIALVEGNRRINYLELKRMVDSLSAGLIKKECVNPGYRISVLALNGIE